MGLQFAWPAAVAILAGSILSVIAFRRKKDPQDKERRRREFVRIRGRIIEGYVTGCRNGGIEYNYRWQGIQYEACQEVIDLIGPNHPHYNFSGPVTVKFLASRPSNSIILAENWSGIPTVNQRLSDPDNG